MYVQVILQTWYRPNWQFQKISSNKKLNLKGVLICQTGVAEWFTVLYCSTRGHGFKSPAILVDTWSASMWIKKDRSPCWPLYSKQVSHQRWIWGSLRVRKHTSKGSTLALKLRADITGSSKQGHQWPHKKDLCPPESFKDVEWDLTAFQCPDLLQVQYTCVKAYSF